MSQQEHDKTAEEQDAPELIADIQAIYAANAQSLARIRSRLQHRTTRLPAESTPVSLPISSRNRTRSGETE